jgi:hypothetical protein
MNMINPKLNLGRGHLRLCAGIRAPFALKNKLTRETLIPG